MDCEEEQKPGLIWRDGNLPVSARFDDPYYSQHDGLAECRHVFLHGNHLPERFRPGFQVAELGFGTGLNLLATWQCWQQAGIAGPLQFTSFEANPLTADDMARALARWPEIAALATPLLAALQRGNNAYRTKSLDFRLITGDAVQTVPPWAGKADAWFLDGFSPARNPAMWSPELMLAVARHTLPGGSFATYTAAGHVRRALEAAGFAVERAQGFAGKRHMSRGILR